MTAAPYLIFRSLRERMEMACQDRRTDTDIIAFDPHDIDQCIRVLHEAERHLQTYQAMIDAAKALAGEKS